MLDLIALCTRRVEVTLRCTYYLILITLTSSILIKVYDGVLITLSLLVLLRIVLYGVIFI
jgi:hypothetical protein